MKLINIVVNVIVEIRVEDYGSIEVRLKFYDI